jgi:hypothetical protein
MHRIAAGLLCALLAGGLVAAPAPLPRAVPWVSGWDKPIGDGRFHRNGDKLILIPGRKHDWQTAPRLLRDVEGDFVVQVRVVGSFRPLAPANGNTGYHQAGVLVTDGTDFVRVERVAIAGRAEKGHYYTVWPIGIGRPGLDFRGQASGLETVYQHGLALDKAAYLRVERRGDTLRAASSEDGKKWTEVPIAERGTKWPSKLKVGVIAEATAPGEFEPVFDQFKLSPLK